MSRTGPGRPSDALVGSTELRWTCHIDHPTRSHEHSRAAAIDFAEEQWVTLKEPFRADWRARD